MTGMLTIAKNSNEIGFLRKAYSLGFKSFRLNMDYEKESLKALENIKSLKKSDIKIFADFQGVKMRIQLPEQVIEKSYKEGDKETFYFSSNNFPYISNIENVVDYLAVGQTISIADEKINGTIIEKYEDRILVQFNSVTYVIRQNAGCSFIGDGIPPVKMTKKACFNIEKHEVIQNKLIDWVILSFAADATEISDFTSTMHKMGIKVMAKIETIEGVENILELSTVVDGFMIGRGDLKNTAKENFENYYKKALEDVTLNKKEFSGVGTFFLSNFSETNNLTDQELNDVINVKSKKMDYIMLSKEVVNSKFPFETIQLLNELCIKEKRC